MTDDVRAAAERLRRYYAGDDTVFRHRDDDARFTGDVLLLVGRVPADDGEPVTEDWLRAVGFRPDEFGCLWLGDEAELGYRVEPRPGEPSRWRYSDPEGDTVYLPAQTTRGHVRRLAEALWMHLTETPEKSQ